ncbi:MAG: hypothetical protein A2293_02295 [Elusimicrobia bacterium RIFOXYB2_FULL_49_7]|nr:MAG: hypothetical protein A2293_02295 [Elusimicrobia bacterium RIFOXYB2_FULL_49_7]
MKKTAFFFLFVIALCCVPLFADFEKLRWGISLKKLTQHCHGLKRAKNPCYFDGVNVFGPDTLRTVFSNGVGRLEKKRSYFFHQKGLVAVEVQYDQMDLPTFDEAVVRKLKKKHGESQLQCVRQQDSTKQNLFYIWRLKEDVVVAAFGHFIVAGPSTYDWVRVTYYEKKFYSIKNAARNSLAGSGDWCVYY